jgi:hypothetical protein
MERETNIENEIDALLSLWRLDRPRSSGVDCPLVRSPRFTGSRSSRLLVRVKMPNPHQLALQSRAGLLVALAVGVGGALSCGSSAIPAIDGGGGAHGGDAMDRPANGGAAGTPADGSREQIGAIGTSCLVSGDCAGGHCFDGVCCQDDCSQACHSCALPDNVGTCLLAEVGTDPRDDCPDEGSASCGSDGTCDGSGACRKYPTGIVCKAPSCSGSTVTLAFRCGGGVCSPTSGQPCDPYICGTATSCANTCTRDADCTPPNKCENGSCGKRPQGGACSVGDECNSGICQQNVCCGTTCTGTCRSCAVPGSEGTCTNVPERQDPLNQCNDSGPASCGTDGACDGLGACHFYARGTSCRPVAGICDVAETCDGTGAPCPADGFVTGTVCRASAGVCDLAEVCSGTSASCPPDAFAPAATVCRQLAGICDTAESCTGTGAACPPDGFAAAGTVCRASAGSCDVAESCTGTGAACPADRFMNAGAVCRSSAGACDSPEVCSGTVAACPPDGFLAAGTVCRGPAGTCDAAESCSGTSLACPPDALLPAATVCRASAGICDVAESCNGASPACPPDGFVTGGTLCRGSAGVCDVVENCTGTAAACPPDGFVGAGTPCRGSAGVCDAVESCTGASAACPPDSFVAAGIPCRGAVDLCDSVESCTGTAAACPPDALVAAGTSCRAAAGVCDVAESCSGTSVSCPPDGFVAAGTTCRASAGICDVAESCNGTTAACPPDGFVGSGVQCRAATGVCDLAEACTGGAAACPADVGASPPAAPTGLVAQPFNGQVILSWTAVAGATAYNVKRGTASGGPYTTVGTTATPTFTNSGLANGTTFFFVVSATSVGGGCESANSAQVAAIPNNCAGVYCDNFEADTVGSNANGWTAMGGGASDWAVVSEGSKFFAQIADTSPTLRASLTSRAVGAPWTGAISAASDIKLTALGGSAQAAMICPRFVDLNNYYCLALLPAGAQIQTRVGGTANNSALFPQGVNVGSINMVKLSLSAAGVLSATFAGSVRGTLTPTALASGFAAVVTTSVEAEFDNIVVSQP